MEEDYDLIVGKSSHVHSLSNEVMVPIIETGGLKRTLNIEIRIFNDGAAFRSSGRLLGLGSEKVEITDERTLLI